VAVKKGKDMTDKKNEIAVADETPSTDVAVVDQEPSIMGMLAQAVKDPDFDANKLEQLIKLKERVDATEAKKAFQEAMFRFHENPPIIKKTKSVYGKDRSKGPQYHYPDFAETVRLVRPALRAVGIIATWSSEPLDNGMTRVTCTLRHALGHEEHSSMAGAPETGGSKNAIQGVGSADSFLRRYTYLSATGLVAEGDDTDGNVEDERITEKEAEVLLSIADEAGLNPQGLSYTEALCRYFKVDSIRDLPGSKFYEAKEKLMSKLPKKGTT